MLLLLLFIYFWCSSCEFYLYIYFLLDCCCTWQDYYKILEVDYDATDDAIRSNYIRLALVCVFVSSFFFVLGFGIGSIFVVEFWGG